MTTLSLRGTHGTTVSRANSIQQKGFTKSEGKLGVGVYFWVDGEFAEKLAYSWWEYYSSVNVYKKDKNSAYTIFIVGLSLKEKEFLDLERHDLKQSLASLCVQRKVNFYASKRKVMAVISDFIKELQKEMGTTYKVFESGITTPPIKKFCTYYPVQVLGMPHSYIVLDTSCISILSVSVA